MWWRDPSPGDLVVVGERTADVALPLPPRSWPERGSLARRSSWMGCGRYVAVVTEKKNSREWFGRRGYHHMTWEVERCFGLVFLR